MLGVVVFAHGSRDPLWRLPVEGVAKAVIQRDPAAQVRCAYLELSTPALPEAVADLVAAGCTRIRVMPLFFGMGKHAREDLPLLIEELRQAYPAVGVECLPAVGEHPELTALLADIALRSQTAP